MLNRDESNIALTPSISHQIDKIKEKNEVSLGHMNSRNDANDTIPRRRTQKNSIDSQTKIDDDKYRFKLLKTNAENAGDHSGETSKTRTNNNYA